ncbi:MAG: hypothetical protein HZA74_12805 [Ignavibacteriales bacterium]|jgi:hypothetical protein|nr:hypothetical protein [Ignavibacteriales bacterium]
MKKIILLYFLFAIIIYADGKDPKKIYGRELFPSNATKQFVYESTFGETNTIALIQGGHIETKSQSDIFKYFQKLDLKDDGLYVVTTYQWLKILKIFTKENNITYTTPLKRYALPLYVGLEWKDETTEIIDGEPNQVTLNAKVLAEEEIQTLAGKFTALKIQTIVESVDGSKNIVTEWIAENIGLVKSIIEIKGGGITGLIRDILGLGKLKFELKNIIN